MVPSGSASLQRSLPQYARAVFEQVRADCVALRVTDIEEIKEPTWEDLYRSEIALLRARDEFDLRRSAWAIRQRFRNIAGERAYDQYVASSPPDPATAELRLLYADLLTVLRRTYYIMILIPASDQVRRMLIVGSSIIGLVDIAAIILVVVRPNDGLVFPICLMCGAIGGVMSLMQRLKQLPDGDPLLFRLSGSATLVQSLVIPPITGAIFAGILSLLFTAHAIMGDLFPSINSSGTTLTEFIVGTKPANGQSFALLFVWSFLAGFAERLVPDAIERFVARSHTSR